MASYSVMETFKVHKNQKFLDLAESLKPKLYKETVLPEAIVSVEGDSSHNCTASRRNNIENLPAYALKKDESVCLDFGRHITGYVTLSLSSSGSHLDAPAYLRLKFGEIPAEIIDKTEDYNGWISRSWIQEEFIHVDVLPAQITLPRRYAFRYMEIQVIDTSAKYQLRIEGVCTEAVSSVCTEDVAVLHTGDEQLDKIDEVSIRTLAECMQDVFEDGPKRDRRLWLGDFRLQARANYETFRHNDLVKRCLYLFCGMPFNEDQLSACLFTDPEPDADDTYLLDYALFIVPVLLDYYEETKDMDTLKDLYPIAMQQIDYVLKGLDNHYLVVDKGEEFWCFIDWGDGLNKQASAQAVLIYTLRYGIRLAAQLDDQTRISYLEEWMEKCRQAAIDHFWDAEQQLFVSGPDKQISWASQVWMVLARVFDQEKSRELLRHTIMTNPRIRMVTPYMYHHYVDALIRCGEEDMALEELKRYWGEMIHDGADTFWELYNPYNKQESPYGSSIVNSYCHAWSCTPTYFLRKFFAGKYDWKLSV